MTQTQSLFKNSINLVGDKKLLLRFLLVGGLNTVFGYSVFSIAIYLNVHYAIAALLGQVLGTLFNFGTISRLVFGSKDNTLFFKFIAVYVFTYLLNVAGLRIFSTFHVNMYLAAAIVTLPVSLVGFLLNKNFVFIK
jgi:putative flippase GtrA